MRILVVDDEPSVRALLGTVLADEGYAVQTAPDGRAALMLVAASPPDLIVTDVVMPHLDGWGLLAQVRERSPTPPLILIRPFRIEALLASIGRLTGS